MTLGAGLARLNMHAREDAMSYRDHKAEARELKAQAIADAVVTGWILMDTWDREEWGACSSWAAAIEDEDLRHMWADAARQHPPTVYDDGSCPTWERVVEILGEREQAGGGNAASVLFS